MLADTNILAQSPLFEGVPPGALEIAREAFQTLTYAAGKKVFEAGDPGEALYIVQSGRIKIYRTNLDDKEKVLAYLNPGDLFGEMSLVEDIPRSATALALEDTVLLALYRQEYYGLTRRYPEVAHNLARILARRLREMNLEVEVLSFEEARGRVAYALLKLYRHRYGEQSPQGWRVPATHQELALMAGTSRETVTRVLHALRDEAILRLLPGKVEILDTAALEEVLYGLR